MRRFISEVCWFVLLPIWLLLVGIPYAQFNSIHHIGVVNAAHAQFSSFPPGTFNNRAALDAAGGGATNCSPTPCPGDVVSSATVWYGLRAYSLAKAGNAAVNACISNVSSTCADFSTDPTSGNLVFNSSSTISGNACAWTITSGTYTTATGAVVLTISGTTLVNSANFPIAVTGLTGTGSLSTLNGGWASNASSTGATVGYTGPTGLGTVTITGGTLWTCVGKKLYDQTQANNCSSATCDVTFVGFGVLVAGCQNSQPCLMGNTSFAVYSGSANALTSVPIGYTVSYVGQRTYSTPTAQVIFVTLTASNGQSGFGTSANEVFGYAGTASVTLSGVTDGVAHSIQTIYNGASGNIYADGAPNTKSMGSGSAAGTIRVMGTASQWMSGNFMEVGLWPSAFGTGGGGTASQMCHNQYTYWATAASC
jgi:hypothetical protein